MPHVILYETATGKITNSMYMTDNSLTKTLEKNPHISYIEGATDVNKTCVNVNVSPHVIENKPVTAPDINEHIRLSRQYRLKACDWTQGVDSPLSDAKKAEWATYRQALRDLPTTNTATEIKDIAWPILPE
jgi:hypothetical protein